MKKPAQPLQELVVEAAKRQRVEDHLTGKFSR
jgi:hypothetical protein